MQKILVTLPSFSESAKPSLEAIGEVEYKTPTQVEMDNTIGDYTILVVGLGINFKKETLEKAKQLKVLATATTGLDHIDLNYAKEKGIEVLSLKGENEFLDTITGTSELAFGLMLDLLRGIGRASEAVAKRGEWRREDYRGSSLYGKTLGLIGMGRLGKIMGKGADGFRMKVIFSDPNVEASAFPEFEKVPLDRLLKESDVVAVHVHLTDDTTNMISERELALMKKSAVLINTARGKIVDEAAVLKALESGVIAGYGADVLTGENDFGENAGSDPLVKYAGTHNNVIITPHIGGMTADSRAATDVFIAEKVSKYLEGA